MIYGNHFLKSLNEAMAGKFKLPYTYNDIDYIKLGQDILKSIPSTQKIKQIFDKLKKMNVEQLKEEKKKLYPDLLFDTSKVRVFNEHFKSVSSCAEFGKLFEKVLLYSEFALKNNYGTRSVFNTKEEGKTYFIKRYNNTNNIETISDKMMDIFDDIANKYNQISKYFNTIVNDKNSTDDIISIAKEASKKAESISNTVDDYYVRHGDEWMGDTIELFDNFTKNNENIDFPYSFEYTNYKAFIDDLKKAMPTKQKINNLRNMSVDVLDDRISILRSLIFDTANVKSFKDYLSKKNTEDEYEYMRYCEDMISDSFLKEYGYIEKIIFKSQEEGKKYFISTFKSEEKIDSITSEFESALYRIAENYSSLAEYSYELGQKDDKLSNISEMIAEAFENVSFMIEKLAEMTPYRTYLVKNFNIFVNG